MTRPLAVLSAAVILAAAAQAQCLGAPTGSSVSGGFVAWNGFDGIGGSGFDPIDDEGLTSPPIVFTAFPSFPMAGVAATLDRMMIGTNGVIYLGDAATVAPVGGDEYGFFDLPTLRGGPGGSPRIVPLGDDMEASPTGIWDVLVDQSVAGQVTVRWVDITRWNGTDQFSFEAILFASGAVQFNYGPGIPADFRAVGISIGNDVGSAASPSLDLTGGANSGTEGLLYEDFDTVSWDLTNASILISPNGSGGYLSTVVCGPASHTEYGLGCHDVPLETFYEFLPDAAVAAATLNGNAMLFTPTANGFTGTWLPTAAASLYVAPTGAAAPLTPTDDGSTVVALTTPFPNPFGPAATDLTVSHNGIVTLGTVGNNDFDFSPDGADVAAATGAAWYSWSDYRDTNTTPVPSGTIKTETVGSTLYITWDGVDHWTDPQVSSPSTLQFQFDSASGNVTLVWVSIDANTTSIFGSEHLVGFTGPGAGLDPGSISLSAAGSVTSSPDVRALTLSASPAPVINPSTLVTYTLDNLREFVPGSGIYVSTLFFSVAPNPAGFDLSFIGLTTVPGCNAYIGSLDVDLGAQLTFTPTATWDFTFDNVIFAPGNTIAAQGIGVFDGAVPLPNGESGGLLFSNGVQSTTQPF